MIPYAQIFEQFEQESLFAVLVRSALQRLLPPTQLDQLFNDTAEKQ